MIPGPSPRIVLATRPVDFRRGHDALTAAASLDLGVDIYSGVIVIFRSKRGDRLKILAWDGTGLVLTYKRLGGGAASRGLGSRTGRCGSRGASSKPCSRGWTGAACRRGRFAARWRRSDTPPQP